MQSHLYPDEHDVYEIAVDEVGRGCLYGPVYVAAVVLPKAAPSLEEVAAATQFALRDLKDSKKFSSKKRRAAVAQWIREHAVAHAVAFESAETIDRVNILQATQMAMHAAIRAVIAGLVRAGRLASEAEAETRVQLLIDGNYFKPFVFHAVVGGQRQQQAVRIIQLPHHTVEQGDATYRSIAAASILAKNARDQHMADLCAAQPLLAERYGIQKNMGYGTADHMQGLRTYGVVPGHRLSFSPCRAAKGAFEAGGEHHGVRVPGQVDAEVSDSEGEEDASAPAVAT